MFTLLKYWQIIQFCFALLCFGIINKGETHSDSGCHFSAPNSQVLSSSFFKVFLDFWSWKWYCFAPSLNLRETCCVPITSIPSKRSSHSVRSFSNLLIQGAQVVAFFLHYCIEICFFILSIWDLDNPLCGFKSTLRFMDHDALVCHPCSFNLGSSWKLGDVTHWQNDFINVDFFCSEIFEQFLTLSRYLYQEWGQTLADSKNAHHIPQCQVVPGTPCLQRNLILSLPLPCVLMVPFDVCRDFDTCRVK